MRNEAIETTTLGVVIMLGAYVAARLVERGKAPEAKRFWRLTIRHAATAIFVMALLVIWRTELQSLILALGAATAGFLVAFRELWLNWVSFWSRVVKRQISLHDFIEVDGHHGRVTDITWMTTTLAETTTSFEGLSYTGRLIHVPNARMLLATVSVENFTDSFSPHTFKLHLPVGANILKAEALLVASAERHCAPFYDAAEKYLRTARDDAALDLPSAKPRVRIQLAELGHATLLLRMVVPFKDRARVEQLILHDFLQSVNSDTWPRKVAK